MVNVDSANDDVQKSIARSLEMLVRLKIEEVKGTRTQIDGHPTRQREHLVKYREQGLFMVDFDGGEPTLNPELIPLIRDARRMGYTRLNVTTNGRMCAYENYAAKLVNSGLTTLLFSVHGPVRPR